MSKHPIFGSILQQLHYDHRFSPDPFCALAEFKTLLHKAKKMTQREQSRQTPDCAGAKLLITSTVLRAYRNRHLGTLMRCCEAWKPIEDCFDTLSFECVHFRRLSHIFASLTRENLATRETEVSSLPYTQTEKDIALARCRNSQRAWRNKKPVLTLSAVTDEEATPWRMKMKLAEDFVSIGDLFAKHDRKARDTFIMKKFCVLSSKLLMTSLGLLTRLSLMTSLLPRKTQPLDLMEFHTVSSDVLVALVQSSSFMLIKPFWRKGIFLIVLLIVGQSLSLKPLTPMTLERFFDHLMHFGH